MKFSTWAISASVLAMFAAEAGFVGTANAAASAEQAQSGNEAIVVTARRKEESLQDVPQTVNIVTAETTEKLAIRSFEDIASVVPGLALGGGGNSNTPGGFPAPALRGFTNDFLAAGSPSVDIYQNEVLFEGRFALTTIYDIGSFQILQGPQGTARGRSAPTGAILITTHRPDTTEYGGYVSGVAATKGEASIQGALNIPVIKDVLGVRFAGAYNSSRGNFARSVNSDVKPERTEWSGRVSALFTPFDNFDALVTWQHTEQDLTQFPLLEGTGAPGGVSPQAPAGYNGPVIRAAQRLGVSEVPDIISNDFDLVTAQANLHFGSQQLSYIFGRETHAIHRDTVSDEGNLLIGDGNVFDSVEDGHTTTHEVRLSSNFGSDSFFDYTVGYFRFRNGQPSVSTLAAGYNTGAFSALPTFNPIPDPTLLNRDYVLFGSFISDVPRKEDSIYATVTFRPTPRTEITLGGRQLWYKQGGRLDFVSAANARNLLGTPAAFGATDCAGVGPAIGTPLPTIDSLYSGGVCDLLIPGGVTLSSFPVADKASPFIYNGSISHRFSDELLAYATIASSFRPGSVNVGVNNANNVPELNALAASRPEKSTSYEIGIKTNLLDNRLRLNISAFYQKYKNLLLQVPGIPYRSATAPCNTTDPTCGTVSVFGFNTNADAISKGFSIDAAFQATPEWNINLGVNYAKAKIDNDTVPCRDGNFDGVPDLLTPTVQDFIDNGTYVASCKSNAPVTQEPYWNVVLQSEYEQPLGSVNGYVRGLLNYNSSNSRRSPGYTVPDYALLNLYAGVRDPDGAWDVGLFVRNVASAGVKLSQGLNDVAQGSTAAGAFGLSGYNRVSYTPPRQIGIQARFSFGSR